MAQTAPRTASPPPALHLRPIADLDDRQFFSQVEGLVLSAVEGSRSRRGVTTPRRLRRTSAHRWSRSPSAPRQGLPRRKIGLDLPRMILQVRGVDAQPVPGGVAARLGVTPRPPPGVGGE